ncbi:MAG: RNA polymerase sigma factor [Pirellulaceae bacterium]
MNGDLRKLVRRCLEGDQSAMRELVERYQGHVFGLCYRMLGNRQDAEDVAQETFLRVLRSLSRWDSNRRFEPWLLAIAANRCRTALAARQRRPALQPLLEPPAERPHDDGSEGPLAEEVARGLERLRPEYREAFVLFHENELSYDEIATAIKRPLGTVKTWIHRARRELIQYLVEREVVTESCNAVRSV